jgi:uroporphyrin-III C-methyltransferase/precorrin-2 dehydrogenase/sirohydrochlorin ferrochelatase
MTRFRYFLVSYAVAGRRVLVVGNGEAGLQKLRLLARTEAKLVLVADDPAQELAAFAAAHDVTQIADLADDAISDAALAFVATGDEARDARVAARMRAAGVPVNVVDRPLLSDFATPSIVDRAPISIAIATDGHAPVLAIKLRGMIEALLPQNLGRVCALAARLRQRVRARLLDTVIRRRLWADVLDGGAAKLAMAGNIDAAADVALAAIDDAAATLPLGRVIFIGIGPGDADLLTLRAHRLLLAADVVVHDSGVTEAVLAMARRDVERVRLGRHSDGAAASLLARLGSGGRLVVRLTAGDATASQIGGEIAAVRAAGIDVEIVPGVAGGGGASPRSVQPAARKAA